MNKIFDSLMILMPEISMASMCLLSLTFCILAPRANRAIIYGKLALILVILYFMNLDPSLSYGEAFGGSFVMNNYGLIFKNILLGGSFIIMLGYVSSVKSPSVEFCVISLFSVIGGMVALSSRDLLVLFMGLELQSLPSYILAAYARDNPKSSEAGLKYFVLGSAAAGIMLFGMSMIYGFGGGSMSYDAIFYSLLSNTGNIGVIVGISMILVSLMFKFSIAPFHMWTPDVYEGAPTYSVSIFASLHKISIAAVIVAFLGAALQKYTASFAPIVKIVAVMSLVVGSFAGVVQTSVKRLLGYSTIFHLGFILLAIYSDMYIGYYRSAFLNYIIVYSISAIVFLIIIYEIFGDRADNLKIKDLAGLGQVRKLYSMILTITLVSMLGLPPMAGFFIKYDVLYDLISLGEYVPAIFALVTSIVTAYYYLNIIKSIYFDFGAVKITREKASKGVWLISVSVAGFLLLFGLFFADYFNKLKIYL